MTLLPVGDIIVFGRPPGVVIRHNLKRYMSDLLISVIASKANVNSAVRKVTRDTDSDLVFLNGLTRFYLDSAASWTAKVIHR